MNDDYLWDRTGEPDPEVQQLEQVLGTLRYQPRPLEIPARPASLFKPNLLRNFAARYATGLAVAATIAVMLLGLGLWLGLQRRQTTEVAKTEDRPVVSGVPVEPRTGDLHKNQRAAPGENNDNGTEADVVAHAKNRVVHPGGHRLSEKIFARNRGRTRRGVLSTPELAANEIREAEAAKIQLMLALRVASSKLNFVQRKTQGANTENVIHNQHKIG
ncbi:MAG: hypothetical protein M3R67_10505 [Acidobacteriota bacterium]|nr:hypothetical protein [Acidobacteriota bacterium]